MLRRRFWRVVGTICAGAALIGNTLQLTPGPLSAAEAPAPRAAAGRAGAVATCGYRLTLPVVAATSPGFPGSPLARSASADAQPCVLVALQADHPSGQLAGTTVVWTAVASGSPKLEYRFSVRSGDGPPAMVRDYDPSNRFAWTPTDEGRYVVQVTAREPPPSAAPVATLASFAFEVTSPAAAGEPVISPTANPLVALYSLPPCGTGSVRVWFNAGGDPRAGLSTPGAPCAPDRGTNLHLVGMLPSTTYAVQAEVTAGGSTILGPVGSFTTGALPGEVPFPTVTTPVALAAGASLAERFVYHIGLPAAGHRGVHFATDLAGRVVWYEPDPEPGYTTSLSQPLPGGNTLVYVTGPSPKIRLLDPAGNVLRETSDAAINEQLATMASTPGHTVQQYHFLHHELRLLPNGHVVALSAVDRVFPPGTQGSTSGAPVDVMTDQIVDLDQNWQVDWVWNAFDHFDVNQRAVLNETAKEPWGTVNDWTHSNAVVYSAKDHALLLSVRHLDRIVKIAYDDGVGDGHVVWQLGNGLDFALTNPPAGDVFPWFSHQHGIATTDDGRLVTFDDGNTRCALVGPGCHSRGQAYRLDEAERRATLVVDADVGNTSPALGWAQVLQNGDYFFTSGLQSNNPQFGQGQEFDPTGTTQLYAIQDLPSLLYRAYRMPSLYSGCCGQ